MPGVASQVEAVVEGPEASDLPVGKSKYLVVVDQQGSLVPSL